MQCGFDLYSIAQVLKKNLTKESFSRKARIVKLNHEKDHVLAKFRSVIADGVVCGVLKRTFGCDTFIYKTVIYTEYLYMIYFNTILTLKFFDITPNKGNKYKFITWLECRPSYRWNSNRKLVARTTTNFPSAIYPWRLSSLSNKLSSGLWTTIKYVKHKLYLPQLSIRLSYMRNAQTFVVVALSNCCPSA